MPVKEHGTCRGGEYTYRWRWDSPGACKDSRTAIPLMVPIDAVGVWYRMRSADAVLPLTPVDMFAAPRRKEGKYGTTTYCSS